MKRTSFNTSTRFTSAVKKFCKKNPIQEQDYIFMLSELAKEIDTTSDPNLKKRLNDLLSFTSTLYIFAMSENSDQETVSWRLDVLKSNLKTL